jgi:hypothetical protein
MLQWFLNKAQRSVDDAVGSYLVKAAVAVPFLIAAAFGVASFTTEVTRIYGTAGGYFVIALLFGLIGIAAFAASVTPEPQLAGTAAEVPAPEATETAPVRPMISQADSELLLAIAGTAAPALVPILRSALVRHWPFILLVVALLVLWLTADRSRPAPRDSMT